MCYQLQKAKKRIDFNHQMLSIYAWVIYNKISATKLTITEFRVGTSRQ